jgi:hypothetical protein
MGLVGPDRERNRHESVLAAAAVESSAFGAAANRACRCGGRSDFRFHGWERGLRPVWAKPLSKGCVSARGLFSVSSGGKA